MKHTETASVELAVRTTKNRTLAVYVQNVITALAVIDAAYASGIQAARSYIQSVLKYGQDDTDAALKASHVPDPATGLDLMESVKVKGVTITRPKRSVSDDRMTRLRLTLVLSAATGVLPGEDERHDAAFSDVMGGRGSKDKVERWAENLLAGRAHRNAGKVPALEASQDDATGEAGESSTEATAGAQASVSESLTAQTVKAVTLLAANIVKGAPVTEAEREALMAATNALVDALEAGTK